MTAPRSYLIGLPVVLTVRDDGTVIYEVDLSEAADAISKENPEYMTMYDDDGNEMPMDAETLNADLERIQTAVIESRWRVHINDVPALKGHESERS